MLDGRETMLEGRETTLDGAEASRACSDAWRPSELRLLAFGHAIHACADA